MLFGTEDVSCKDYLVDNTDVLLTVEKAMEEMLRKYSPEEQAASEEKLPDPLTFLATFLKRHNPKHNEEFAAVIQQMRAAGVGSAAKAEA